MFLRKIIIIFCTVWCSCISFASNVESPKEIQWPFDGVFGYFDKQAIQRGFHVFKEVCQACHSLKYMEYNKLEKVGFTPAEVKSIAAEYTTKDGPNDEGEMFDRPSRPTDKFLGPYANEKAARAANNGAYPPDLSLIVKARADGANYVYSILTGYGEPPANFKLSANMHYNPYFPGHQIAMTPPLMDGIVTHSDGSSNNIDELSRDVVTFLQWVSEPEMETRKVMGIKVILYLVVFTVVFYIVKRKVWKDVD